MTSHTPSSHLDRPQPGDNSVDVCSEKPHTGCGPKEDNMCMTAPQLLVTTLSRRVSCGQPKLIHRNTELSPTPVRESSTRHQLLHLQRCGLSTESTVPMTMMRPIERWIQPRVPGDEEIPDAVPGSFVSLGQSATRTAGQVLATRPGGTKVDPHLRKTQCCVAVSTHVCRRAGYR